MTTVSTILMEKNNVRLLSKELRVAGVSQGFSYVVSKGSESAPEEVKICASIEEAKDLFCKWVALRGI